MAISVKYAHVTLCVKTVKPADNANPVFISAFSGFITFGEIQLLCYSEQSITLKISEFVEFFEELKKVIKFFDFECIRDNFDSCYLCLPKPQIKRNWKGKIGNNTTLTEKSVALFKSNTKICSFNEKEILDFIDTLLKVILYTFIFNETDILFFQTILNNPDIFIDSQFADENKLEELISNHCLSNKTNKLILKQLFCYYKEEVKVLFQFNLLINGKQ